MTTKSEQKPGYRAQGKKIKEIMENCIKLEVPSKVDTEMNESWGG